MSIIPFPAARLLPGFSLPVTTASPARVKALDELQAIFSRRPSPSTATREAAAVLDLPLPAAAAAELPKLQIISRGNKALKKLTGFIGPSQLATVKSYLKGEEGQWFMEKMEELAAIVESMPKTYGQSGKGDDAICYLHYFGGSYDGYLTEKDMEEPEDPAEAQWQAFGYVHWAQNGPSLSAGYICLPEIFKSRMELDFHFTPTTVREIKRKHGAAVSEPPSSDEVSEFQTPLDALRHHVTGAIERGEGEAIVEIPPLPNPLAEKQMEFLAMKDGFQVGAILTHSWGYEQTNVDYHRIIKRTKSTVILERLNTATQETGFMCGKIVPLDEVCPHDKETITRRITAKYNGETSVKIRDPHHATLWDSRPGNCSWYG